MRVLKWIGIVFGILVVVIIVALLVLPRFVDINKYKPKIENMVTESTGRPFSIGGEIDLSLFPWAGISLSDLHLGNPAGFKEKDFTSVKHFEIRVKLLPLIFKDLRVKRFVVNGPKIALERDPMGRGNWEDLLKPSKKKEVAKRSTAAEGVSLPIKNLMVGEFAVTSGELIWIDHQKGTEQRITEINLGLDPISLDQPIGLEFSARLNGKPVEMKGEIGPLGRPVGEGKIPLRLDIRALDELVAKLQGFIADLREGPRFSMEMGVEPFSPRKVAEALGADLSEKFRDPEALREMSLKARVAGTRKAVKVMDGALRLDDSTLKFDMDIKEFGRPVLAFRLDMDRLDLDRYLPPSARDKKGGAGTVSGKRGGEKPDYSSLRRIVADGTVHIGQLEARGATASDVKLEIHARNGILRVDPFSLRLYEGSLKGKLTLNVQGDTPKFQTTQHLKGVQAGPLLKDLGYTDRLAGLMNFDGDISMEGTEPAEIKRTLTGSGKFVLTDGAIVGFDIAQMFRNVGAALGLAQKEKSRTEFSELKGKFTIKNGFLTNPMTYLASPLLRVVAKGKLDLPRETVDYRIEPKLVATIQGQGDTSQRSGLLVPVVVSGTFSDLKIRPDVRAIAESDALKEEAEKLLEGLSREGEAGGKGGTEPLKLLEGLTQGEEGKGEGLENVLPGLFPSRKKD